jgi:hypothetical protein
MDTRNAILDLQYSEKMKSGLIIGINLFELLTTLKDMAEFSGGRKMLIWYLEALLRELRIAQNVIGLDHYVDMERKLIEIIGRIQLSLFEDVLKSFSEALSLATTSCQNSMNILMEKKLV